MCQQQAEGLEKLMTSYQNIGKRDISFFIVNHARGEASVNELTRRVSFPVYQDDNTSMIQQTLNASIDDLFLYDRCGTLVYHLRRPESLVSHGTMQTNLLTTYLGNPCKCTENFKSKVSTKPTLYQLQRKAVSSLSSIIRRRRHVLNQFGTSLVSTDNVPSRNDRPSD